MRRGKTSRPVKQSSVTDRDDATPTLLAEQSGRPRRKRQRLLAFIDPKALTRQSISEKFARGLSEYATVSASSCDELVPLQRGPAGHPELVVVHTRSLQLADPWVKTTLELVKVHLPQAAIVLLSERDDVEDIVNALACGVRGYIPTSVEAEVAFAALRLVAAGGTFVPAHAFSVAAKFNGGSECSRREVTKGLDLTPRELSVIELLREGKPNKRIAAELQMQESTVKVHVRNIMKKLRVGNRTHAASVANRLFGPPPPALELAPPNGVDPKAELLASEAEPPSG
jgi:DNA-binding NarL/FixJ family response regulator